ncbi:MAG: GspH/FimT family pseudopilin [Pseudomonadota bacterium]
MLPTAGKPTKISGFTLIELLISIVVAIVIATIAVPSFKSMVNRNYQVSVYNEFLSLVSAAKSEAVTKRSEVVFTVNSVVSGVEVSISRGGNIVLSRSLGDNRLEFSPSDFTVSFNALGRRNACSEIECEVEISGGSSEAPSKLSIEASGMILGGG